MQENESQQEQEDLTLTDEQISVEQLDVGGLVIIANPQDDGTDDPTISDNMILVLNDDDGNDG
jgi:hypothetical protein